MQSQAKAPAKGAQGQSNAQTVDKQEARRDADPKCRPDLSLATGRAKDPELVTEVGHLQERMIKELQYPATRSQSRILPHLPESTLFYGAFPNYGQAIHQALQIWQEELRQSAPLREFLKKQKAEDAEATFEQGCRNYPRYWITWAMKL